MKLPRNAIKATSYVSGILAVASALLLVILLTLTLTGLIHPRTMQITLTTEDVSKIYSGLPLTGEKPSISSGKLHPGHRMVVRNFPQLTLVGQIENAPDYLIVDETGADVTEQYDILEEFGTLTVQPKSIVLVTMPKSQRYNGQPLTADTPTLSGNLIDGHRIEFTGGNSVLFPGTAENSQSFRILSAEGDDMTDQYHVTKRYGDLTVLPLPLTLRTDSAQKTYDGRPLHAEGWTLESGTLLKGHSLSAKTVTSAHEVGSYKNELTAVVTDANGTDVSYLYEFHVIPGQLAIQAIPLYITTGSASKLYDGTPLSCNDGWVTAGTLEPGATIVPGALYLHSDVGTAENATTFRVIDKDGKDISSRYQIEYNYGTLNLQPRPLTIRTGSAEKVYDGGPLECNTYEILSGSLLPTDTLYLDCVSFLDVGYSENYVLSCFVMRGEDGVQTDVSQGYRITFQYGTLRITAN